VGIEPRLRWDVTRISLFSSDLELLSFFGTSVFCCLNFERLQKQKKCWLVFVHSTKLDLLFVSRVFSHFLLVFALLSSAEVEAIRSRIATIGVVGNSGIGVAVGCVVGDAVGAFVGTVVGAVVGIVVGAVVGATVGAVVGGVVGATVGVEVAAGALTVTAVAVEFMAAPVLSVI